MSGAGGAPQSLGPRPRHSRHGHGAAALPNAFNQLSISKPDKTLALLAKEINLKPSQLQLVVSVRKPGKYTEDKIRIYISNSLTHTHMTIHISTIISVHRNNEPDFPPDSASPKTEKPHRMMLWHGTTLAGAQGILQNGFVCPKGGKLMFGQGIYFADRFSKSAQYCDVNKACHPAKGTKGYVFLCDVSLGHVYKARNPKTTSTTPQPGFDSYKGQGKQCPEWGENWDYFGSRMPIGPTVPDGRFTQHTLEYNEYIVYDPDRIRIRFLAIVDFK